MSKRVASVVKDVLLAVISQVAVVQGWSVRGTPLYHRRRNEICFGGST